MGDLVIHDLDPEVRRRLERRAESRGNSISEEAAELLKDALPAPPELGGVGLGTYLRSLVADDPLTEEEFAIFEQAWTTERKNALVRPPPFSEEDDER